MKITFTQEEKIILIEELQYAPRTEALSSVLKKLRCTDTRGDINISLAREELYDLYFGFVRWINYYKHGLPTSLEYKIKNAMLNAVRNYKRKINKEDHKDKKHWRTIKPKTI